MEITSLQELAHCREQILLLRNHQVLLCQAGEHWGKNSTIFYKKIHNFKEKMFMWLKCINPCCVTFSMWHYPLHTHFGSYFLEQNPKWICLFYNLYYNILCISYMCKWALFIFYLLIPFFLKNPQIWQVHFKWNDQRIPDGAFHMYLQYLYYSTLNKWSILCSSAR